MKVLMGTFFAGASTYLLFASVIFWGTMFVVLVGMFVGLVIHELVESGTHAREHRESLRETDLVIARATQELSAIRALLPYLAGVRPPAAHSTQVH